MPEFRISRPGWANTDNASMSTAAVANESLLGMTLSKVSSPDPEHQRGRKRRRSQQDIFHAATQLPSGESATCRGRCRNRSASRFDLSRNASRLRSGSLSPLRRKLLRVVQLNRHRSQSPSRSRSRYTQDPPKRRRQRTRSRSRSHNGESMMRLEAARGPFVRHDIVIRSESSHTKHKETTRIGAHCHAEPHVIG
ncbi:hypothetical protein F5Y15DRAFT_116042 [Xylariaceae sp. FL0016]|nr:hypothetical protein F5Y15DRAFT_116042 [Xylariaceae sp. FL0016]